MARYTTLRDAVPTMDPFAQHLVGLTVATLSHGSTPDTRRGVIIAHECYDTDHALCVERVTVRWDGGEKERKSLREWYVNALGDGTTACLVVPQGQE